ncbi:MULTISPECIES: sensor domain-containing diguanylate cyclase [Alteromonadaceae]|uniref:sensor domain-containing diguanylate cyclase n=1 Tax=Alteromonadaceae TaxID=72275 RepID=UPI0031087EE4
MENSFEFLSLVLDTITEHIVVIDDAGEIKYVNKSWSAFGDNNECSIGNDWRGVNYLDVCDKAAAFGDEFGANAGRGIRSVIEQRSPLFYLEYPCHSPNEPRWFMMRVSSFLLSGNHYFVISHQNITERKLAEEEVLNLSRIDELTGIANRRYFNEFIESEWRRCHRHGMPICLAIIDLDYFKLLNDSYGHQVGDSCLKSIGKILQKFAKRPSDMCARYGGEEFALVYGDTNLQQAKPLVNELLEQIRSLNIANENSPICSMLTASIGVHSIYPKDDNNVSEFIRRTDQLLYLAKENGRNQISF